MLLSLHLILLNHYWETYHNGVYFTETMCQYEIREQRNVLVWYAGPFQALTNTKAYHWV
jgi:hypothetical protein